MRTAHKKSSSQLHTRLFGGAYGNQHIYWYQIMEFILSAIIIAAFFSMLAVGILGFITALIIVIVANAKRLNGIDPDI